MTLVERRAYCRCGGRIEVETDDVITAGGLVQIFWAAHSTEGHGEATPAAARLARQRKEREAAAEWGVKA